MANLSLQQLNEMNSKAKRLVELMKKGIVEFIFKKRSNGKMRKAKGTLKRSLIPAEAQRKQGRPKKRPEDLVIYYDVEKNGIRSFKDYLLQKVRQKASSSPKRKVNKTNAKDAATNKSQEAGKNEHKEDSRQGSKVKSKSNNV